MEGEGVDRHAASHDQRQRRIPGRPRAGEVEEGDDPQGLRHPGDQEPRAEQRAGERGERQRGDPTARPAAGADRRHDAGAAGQRIHDSTPISQAASAPVVMKVATATSERGARRDTPQMPCPLVQPPPQRVP